MKPNPLRLIPLTCAAVTLTLACFWLSSRAARPIGLQRPHWDVAASKGERSTDAVETDVVFAKRIHELDARNSAYYLELRRPDHSQIEVQVASRHDCDFVPLHARVSGIWSAADGSSQAIIYRAHQILTGGNPTFVWSYKPDPACIRNSLIIGAAASGVYAVLFSLVYGRTRRRSQLQ